jgi:hypothetical protein
MILALTLVVAGIAVVVALGWGLVAAGLRAGDQAGDVMVTTAEAGAGSPPAVVAAVRNPADIPLVAGFSVRRRLLPGWLGTGMTVRVPRRTARRRFGASAQDTVVVVPAGSCAEFRLPAGTPGRRYWLTAVIGQAGGRLRVFRVAAVSGGSAAAGRPERAAPAADRG